MAAKMCEGMTVSEVRKIYPRARFDFYTTDGRCVSKSPFLHERIQYAVKAKDAVKIYL